LNSEERVITTLRREEVDRVPTFEWMIDKKVMNAISPDRTSEEFIYEMDLDAFVVYLDYVREEIGPGMFKDEWGNIVKMTEEEHTIAEGCIKTIDDLKKYEPPDPRAFHRYKTLDKILHKHSGKKAIILHLNDVFSIPRNLLGYEQFLLSIVDNPKLVIGLVELSVEINLTLAKEATKRGVKIVFTGDDFAYSKGLLVSPKSFDEFFYPYFVKVIRGFKEMGLLVIKHTDGNIWSIIDKVVESGIDCLDPLEPRAGMDIASAKKKYGNRIALKGNVDCAETLTFGSKEDVIEETKQCLRDGAPGWGFILSSSNSIHSSVKPENYLAMLETLYKYGRYPIDV
jgi:uroporphyrinogen decarboxylase